MTDQKLEEAIFQLQKHNTENGVKQLAEEAAQLFAHGRHIEAGALLEKAEAMMAKGGPASPAVKHSSLGPVGQAHQSKLEERAKVDEQAMVNIAGKLADGLSTVLKGAFQELERHIVGESLKISSSFEQQIERLEATVSGLAQLKVKFEHLGEAVSEQRSAGAAIGQRHEQLSGVVTVLQEITARHETEFGALRGETTALRGETIVLRGEAKDFSTALAKQVEGLSARVGVHHEELTGLKSTVSDVSQKVGGFIERIDRQAEVLRALSDTQARRAAALDELLGVLTRLKAPAESMVAMAAGQL
jgi:chromosome segregation ATPase